MPLTRGFKQTIQDRAQRDSKFREELFKEGIQCLLSGDMETGKSILRDYINSTLGFQELSALTHTPAKSLMRMFSATGNPQARNLFEVISRLQEQEGIRFRIDLERHGAQRA
ncbi:MAG TPA: transcriptional regulator [Thermoanaerobaculia bacterium]|jgi:hypothetical protein